MYEEPDAFTSFANRLFASWRTSLAALLLVGVVLILGFTGVVEWKTLWGYLSGPIMLFLMKDPRVVKREKREAVEGAVEVAVQQAVASGEVKRVGQ